MHTSPRNQIGEREGRPAFSLHQAERLEALLSDERTTSALLKKALSLKVALIKLGKRDNALAALIALLVVVTATASDDLSGRWRIRYEVENGDADDLTQGSVASLNQKDSTLQGREGFDLVPIDRALNSCVNIFNLYGRISASIPSI